LPWRRSQEVAIRHWWNCCSKARLLKLQSAVLAAPAIVTLLRDPQRPTDLAYSLAPCQLDFRLAQHPGESNVSRKERRQGPDPLLDSRTSSRSPRRGKLLRLSMIERGPAAGLNRVREKPVSPRSARRSASVRSCPVPPMSMVGGRRPRGIRSSRAPCVTLQNSGLRNQH
jgi:hypothetical protein